MPVVSNSIIYRYSIVAAVVTVFGAPVFSQEAQEERTEDSEEIEEIVVVAPKPDDRRRVAREYEDPARAQLLKEFYELQAMEEEYEWRKSEALENPSRIKWGYDPRDEYELRNEMDLKDVDLGRTKPAKVFKFEF